MALFNTILLLIGLIPLITGSSICAPKNAYPIGPVSTGSGGVNPDIMAWSDIENQILGEAGSSFKDLGSSRRQADSNPTVPEHATSFEERQSLSFSCPNTSGCFLWDSILLFCADISTGEVMTSDGECGNFITKKVYQCKKAGDKTQGGGGSGSGGSGLNEAGSGSPSANAVTAPATQPVANNGCGTRITLGLFMLVVFI